MLKRYCARVNLPVGLALAALLAALPSLGQTANPTAGHNPGVPLLKRVNLPDLSLPGGIFSPPRRLPGHIPTKAITKSVMVGQTNPNQPIKMAVILPIRNQPQLTDLLHQLYNPSDPHYGHYLTVAQFEQQFSPTPAQYGEVEAYFASRGFRITGTSPNRLVLDVEGPAGLVGSAFSLRLFNYRLPSGRIFYATDLNPLVPGYIANLIVGMAGLDNAGRPHPEYVIRPRFSRFLPGTHQIGTGPGGYLAPDDILHTYNLSNTISTINGSGQTLGLFEMDGYTNSDITTFENYFHLPNILLENVLVDGFNGQPSGNGGEVEVTLDIDMMLSIARGAKKIIVYEGPSNYNYTGWIDTYNMIATEDRANEISTSWGLAEDYQPTPFMLAEYDIFEEMAAQGQSIFAAAGDNGAFDDYFDISVDDPASDPYMCGVGGTTLAVTHPGGAWAGETTWNEFIFGEGAGGGGVSTVWAAPSYQLPVVTAPGWAGLTLGSPTFRNVPDVSLNSDPITGYDIYLNEYGGWIEGIGGTSAAAPLWAAFTALLNQTLLQEGKPAVGFPNPYLYSIAQSPGYEADFHDIADQSNNGYYLAVNGYDDATGWGSFNGDNLLNQSPIAVVLKPSQVLGGGQATGKVVLQTPAPASGLTVDIASDDTSVATVSTPSVTVQAGYTTSNSFTVTTNSVVTTTDVGISATANNETGKMELRVWAALSSAALHFSPSRVAPFGITYGIVTLPGPAPDGGAVITLTDSDPYYSYVPDHMVIPAGQTTNSFITLTGWPPVTTYPTVTATYGPTSVKATFAIMGGVWGYPIVGGPGF